MTQEVVCIKMSEEDKKILDAFASRVTGGNRSKAIKDALKNYMLAEASKS